MEETVIENIKRIIKEKGMKQIAVAEMAGYGKSAFNHMMNGRKMMRSGDILAIATTLEVTPNDLYGFNSLLVSNKRFNEILVTDSEGGLIASITEKDVVVAKGYKVTCVPDEN